MGNDGKVGAARRDHSQRSKQGIRQFVIDRPDGATHNGEEIVTSDWRRFGRKSKATRSQTCSDVGTSVLHQRAFTEKFLKAFDFWQYSKPTKTPQAPGTNLITADKSATFDPVLHRRYIAIVGALGWLIQGTRPNISHAYSELSKFVQFPGQIWTLSSTA